MTTPPQSDIEFLYPEVQLSTIMNAFVKEYAFPQHPDHELFRHDWFLSSDGKTVLFKLTLIKK